MNLIAKKTTTNKLCLWFVILNPLIFCDLLFFCKNVSKISISTYSKKRFFILLSKKITTQCFRRLSFNSKVHDP